MNLQPLRDRLIVEVLEEEEVTIGGIVLPDTAKEKPQRGKVLAVGPGPRDKNGERVPLDVGEGDEVLILRESDVLGKLVRTGGKGKRKLAGATAQ